MRMLNYADDSPLDNLCVYLTLVEAQQMIGYLEQLIADPNQHHFHLSDDDYQREITLTVYKADNLEEYDERSKRLIVEGK